MTVITDSPPIGTYHLVQLRVVSQVGNGARALRSLEGIDPVPGDDRCRHELGFELDIKGTNTLSR